MKKLISLVLVLVLSLSLCVCASAAVIENKSISILFIGNSYAEDSGRQHLYNILTELGYNDVEIGILKIGYCSLATHKENLDNDNAAYTYFHISTETAGEVEITEKTSIKTAMDSYNWEFVSLQQNAANSGLSETYSDASYIYDKVREALPEAKLVWNMTWAYSAYSGSAEFETNYNKDMLGMYRAIVSATQENIVPMGIKVMPTGTAIENARTILPWGLITRDENHLAYTVGRYIAALTVAGSITGMDISDIQYAPEDTEEEYKANAIKSAVAALSNPFERTDLKAAAEVVEKEEEPEVKTTFLEKLKAFFQKIADFFKKIFKIK